MRAALASIAVPLALALAQPTLAGAETICVDTSGADCVAPVETSVQAALTRAQEHAGADLVRIGAGRFQAPTASGFSYTGIDSVTITGAGAGRTVLAGGAATPEAVLTVIVTGGASRAATTVSKLTASAGGMTGGRAVAFISGNVEDASFVAQGTENSAMYALRLLEGSAARRVDATASGPFAVAIGTIGEATVADSRVAGTMGVEVMPATAGIATVERTRITATRYGIDVCNGTAVAEDDAIEGREFGVEVEGSARCGGEGSQFLGRNLTIVGEEGEPSGAGLDVSGNVTNPSATLIDSVLWDLAVSLHAKPLVGRTSTLRVARLAEDTARRELGGAGTLVFNDEGGEVGDPKLLDAANGDFRLGPGSPAIDAGSPGPSAAGESTTDLAGGARLLDGDGDGVARRDIGALEAAAVAPPPPAPLPPVAKPAARDTTPPVLRGLLLRRGRHPHVDLTVSESAKVTITLRGLPRGCRRVSPRCKLRTLVLQTAAVHAGSAHIKLNARLARALGRAASLGVVALDAAGNRSAVKTLRI